jgi:hypothetical protein
VICDIFLIGDILPPWEYHPGDIDGFRRNRAFPKLMAHTRIQGPTSRSTSSRSDRQKRALVATLVTVIATSCTAVHTMNYKCFHPEPYHNSKLLGAAWVQELKDGHVEHMKDNIGVFDRNE